MWKIYINQFKIKMKNTITKFYGLAAILISGALLLNSCKDDDKEEQKKPLITSVAPSEAYVGETVSISGENFMAEGKATKVNFGTTEVTPTENTISFISVKVPELEPGSVNVSVSCGEQVSATTTFKVLEKTVMPMEFSDFSPKTGKFQTEITISGKNFDDNVNVYINGKEQTEKTVNAEGTEIKVKLAKQTGNGKVTLKRQGEDDKEHADELEYTFGYKVSDFFNKKIYGMAFSKDGKVYASTSDKVVVELDKQGNIKETLLEYEYGFERLFMDDIGELYVASHYAFVLEYNPETKKVDTIAKDDNTYSPFDITGDNNGFLFLTTSGKQKVVKIDIENKATEVITTTNEDVTGICLKGDSLFVLTDNGFFSLNKNNGGKRNILTKADGYKFNDAGICLYPTGDMFITGFRDGNLYKMGANYKIKEVLSASQLNVGDTRNIVQDNGGNLYVLGAKVLKISIE